MENLEIDLPHHILFFSNAKSDLPLSGNIVNVKCCKYRKIVQDLVNWTPCLLRLNPAWMDAPPPHREVGFPALPCKNGQNRRAVAGKKKVTLSNLQKSFTKAMKQHETI